MIGKYSKMAGVALAFISALGLVYYFAIARLPEESFTRQQILEKYQYAESYSDFTVVNQSDTAREFFFKSFDGETVYGQITLPDTEQSSYPVMIGVHAMGRSYPRWFVDAIDDRPTVTLVNRITDEALAKGYAVVAIDTRYHGKRKVADKPLRSIWNDLHYFGDKSDYQDMILSTVVDNRVLLDWLDTQPELDASNLMVAGYSMGGQVSLILGAVDNRIRQVVSVVPPFVDNKVALVSPLNLVSNIHDPRVLMIYGERDDVASPDENQLVFERIGSRDKQLVSFPADHILPAEYVESVAGWIL